jgi:3-hydroxyacyl-CoA dehydrogenase
MPQLVASTIQDGVALVRIDNPPVNALSTGVPEGLAAAIDAAERDPAIHAVVIMGAGRQFIAGADIKDLEYAAWHDGAGAPDFHGFFQRVEDCEKPVVMAMHGMTLGGGLDVRVASQLSIEADLRLFRLMGETDRNVGRFGVGVRYRF